MYNIDDEIEQLKEIKDIQDELHILSVLLEYQSSVLQQASIALQKPVETPDPRPRSPLSVHINRSGQNKVGQKAPYSSENHFEKLYNMIQEQETRRKGLEVQAEQANKAAS